MRPCSDQEVSEDVVLVWPEEEPQSTGLEQDAEDDYEQFFLVIAEAIVWRHPTGGICDC